MYLIRFDFRDHTKGHVGPFPTRERAKRYASVALRELSNLEDYEVLQLTIPHAVVAKITWQRSAE